MATLYELTEEYRQLLEMMEDDTVDPEVLQDTLEGVDGEIEAKADNCAKLIRELNGVTSVINEEIERLKARKDVISNNADSNERRSCTCTQNWKDCRYYSCTMPVLL